MWNGRHAASSTIHFNTTYHQKHIAHSGILACVCVLFIFQSISVHLKNHSNTKYWTPNTTNVLLQINSIVFIRMAYARTESFVLSKRKKTSRKQQENDGKKELKVTIEPMKESNIWSSTNNCDVYSTSTIAMAMSSHKRADAK